MSVCLREKYLFARTQACGGESNSWTYFKVCRGKLARAHIAMLKTNKSPNRSTPSARTTAGAATMQKQLGVPAAFVVKASLSFLIFIAQFIAASPHPTTHPNPTLFLLPHHAHSHSRCLPVQFRTQGSGAGAGAGGANVLPPRQQGQDRVRQLGPLEIMRAGTVDIGLLNTLAKELPNRTTLVADKYSVWQHVEFDLFSVHLEQNQA